MDYVICVDVSTDIDTKVYEENDVKLIPMDYSLGDQTINLKGIITRDDIKVFYDSQRNGDLTKTSQITPFMYQEFFEEYLKQGISVLCICLSSGLSSTYNSSLVGIEALNDKYPNAKVFSVDSLSASGGMGIEVERAITNKKKGMSVEENYNDLLNLAKHARVYLMVQDLNYLKRGGRVSATTAVLGTMLNIKPILMLNKVGKLDTISKKHGNKAAIQGLFEYFKNNYEESPDPIYICDADVYDLGELLKEKILALYPNAVIRHTYLNPIIGAHTGPSTVLLCFNGKDFQ